MTGENMTEEKQPVRASEDTMLKRGCVIAYARELYTHILGGMLGSIDFNTPNFNRTWCIDRYRECLLAAEAMFDKQSEYNQFGIITDV